MLNRFLISICLLFTSHQLLAADFASTEVYRIRVLNRVGGLVQVSLDGGKSYSAVGRVKTAANARIIGFNASSYIPSGTVAATAIHGIRIKSGQFRDGVTGKAQMPLIFSLTPLEFSSIPKGYGGHIPRSSGILTDIYSGHSIFRNFSPYVGNPVFIERKQELVALPEDYTPALGDTFVILVKKPDRMPAEIEFENHVGGNVTVRYPDSASDVIAQVDRAVWGVGRYDGTAFTGVGSVNTNHGGVLTLSTAPICAPGTHEGGKVETRGGFMVQPFYHVADQGENAVQVMVIGPKDRTKLAMEGTPPMFNGFINLSRYGADSKFSYRVQVKIDGGEWETVPKIVGRVDNAFTPAYLQGYFKRLGSNRNVTKGVTSIRLLFPEYDQAEVARDLKREAAEYAARTIKSGVKAKSGTVCVTSLKARSDVVSFWVDGRIAYSASSPYRFEWDTTKYANGYHTIDVVDESNSLVETMHLLVQN